MRLRPSVRLLALAGLISISPALSRARAQAVDPAVVGERLQRLAATVDALEATSASQKRQIDGLASELHRLREENTRELANIASRAAQRPWAEDVRRHGDDLKRLANAIEEVDRKRAADHEQVLKVLADLRKSVAALAEAPPPRAATPRSDRPPRGDRSDKTPDSGAGDKGEKADKSKSGDTAAEPATPVKAIPYTVGRGETLSLILEGFNADAKKKGYQTLTLQQVMKFNKIADPKKVPVGATLQLPLYPAAAPKP